MSDAWPFLRLLLPVAWIITATIVALLLYKTSSAVVEQITKGKESQQRVRLLGSAAIAVVIFVLLWRTTPTVGPEPGDVVIVAHDAERLQDAKTELDQKWGRLQACTALTALQQCEADRAAYALSLQQFNRNYDAILHRKLPQ